MSLQYANPNIAKFDAQIKQLSSLPGSDPQTNRPMAEIALQRALQAQVPGSAQYLLVAGELQALKNMQQQMMAGRPKQPPVMQTLMENTPPPQMPAQTPQQAPAPMDAGVAALPAQNLEGMDQARYADGGVVAFSGGASVRNPFLVDEMAALDQMSPEERKEYYRKKFQAREGATPRSSTSPFPARRAPGVMGLAGRTASVFGPALTLGWDQLYGTSDEDMDKLRAFDTAKERLKAAGFTDKDIDAMPRETVYRMASGYQPEARQFAGPSTPGDLRRLEAAAGDPYVTGRGLTPEQSAANIAAASGQGGAGNLPLPPSAGGQMDGIARMLSMQKQLMSPEEAAPDFAKQAKDELAGFGFDFDANKELREQVQKGMAQVDTDRQKAGWAALAQFGFTLASTPGDFLSAVGKAGLPALESYGKEVKDLKKLAREDERLLNQLRRDDNATAMGLAGLTDKKRTAFENRRSELSRDAMRAAATIVGAEISANAPSRDVQMIERFPGQTFAEKAKAAVDTGVIGYGARADRADPYVLEFLKMSDTEKRQLQRRDPERYAMLEMRAMQVLVPKPVGAPGNNAQIRN